MNTEEDNPFLHMRRQRLLQCRANLLERIGSRCLKGSLVLGLATLACQDTGLVNVGQLQNGLFMAGVGAAGSIGIILSSELVSEAAAESQAVVDAYNYPHLRTVSNPES